MNETPLVEQGLRRVIGADEGDARLEGLDDETLLAIHRSLVLLRTYDERSVVYHSQGRIGTYAIFRGHEAIQAGAVHALEERDWIFPSYRESAIGLLRGLPAATILQWWRGHPSGWWNPEDVNVASICVPIGSHVPHAAGLAWGLKLKGSDAVSVAFFGDGATSEGAFHEGANLAAVVRAPVVLLCNNNQWAISTPLSAQTAAARLSDKAVGYGMPAIRVDGNDVLAVYEAVAESVARARAGEGPTFVEAVTYRSAPHATADDPGIYIDRERSRPSASATASQPTRGTSAASGSSTTTASQPCGSRRSRRCGRGSRPPRTRLRRIRSSSSRTPTPRPRRSSSVTSTSCAGCTGDERDGGRHARAAPGRGGQRRAAGRARPATTP